MPASKRSNLIVITDDIGDGAKKRKTIFMLILAYVQVKKQTPIVFD
jgi:hypothetical protein